MIRRSWAALAWTLGLLAGFVARDLISCSQQRQPPSLHPFTLGGQVVRLPDGARVEPSVPPGSPTAS